MSSSRPSVIESYCPLCMMRYEAAAFEFCTRDGARLRPVEALGQRWEGRTVAGRYQIARFLGSGGMAEVFEASDLTNSRRVAIKLMRPQAMTSGAMVVERFRREAQLIALMDHPNVVRIEDYGALEDGIWFMVLELLEGRPLEAVLGEEPLAPAFALEVASQVCDGLQAAHDKQIVHRDIKPANIYLCGSRHQRPLVKLLDLGVAKMLGDTESNLTATGMVFGTPEYMSPEQALGKPVDTRSDLYSLGVVLYRMLTGKVPFEADSFVGVLTKHVTDPVAWPDGHSIPGPLVKLLEKTLAKNPERRHGSARELQAELDRLRAKVESPVTWDPGKPTLNERPKRPTIRRVQLVDAAPATDRDVVELAPDVFWVGRREGSVLERNTYLCTYRGGDAQLNVLIDPGPPKDLATLSAKVSSVIGSLDRVDLIFLNHQDPDVAGNAAVIQEMNPRAHVWCSEDAWRLVHFYGLKPRAYSAVEQFRDHMTRLVTGHEVQFVPTPFCHFRGAVMYYDRGTRTLFSGDLFGGLSRNLDLVPTVDPWPGVEIFHQLYMPSRLALQRAVAAVWKLDPLPLVIAPQHGALIRGEEIPTMLERIEGLEVGLDLLGDEVAQESYLAAINEIIATLVEQVGRQRASEELRAFSVDGSFPNLFVFDEALQVVAIKIEPRAALRALIASVARSLDESGKTALGRLVEAACARHSLPSLAEVA